MAGSVTESVDIVLRSEKGSELTHDEMDANFNEITLLKNKPEVTKFSDRVYNAGADLNEYKDWNIFNIVVTQADIDEIVANGSKTFGLILLDFAYSQEGIAIKRASLEVKFVLGEGHVTVDVADIGNSLGGAFKISVDGSYYDNGLDIDAGTTIYFRLTYLIDGMDSYFDNYLTAEFIKNTGFTSSFVALNTLTTADSGGEV